MRAAALSLAGVDTGSFEAYRKDLLLLLKEAGADLAVLPAYASLKLFSGMQDENVTDFTRAFQRFMEGSEEFRKPYLDLHAQLARELKVCLVAGATVEKSEGRHYQTVYVFDPAGAPIAAQRQTHLSRAERELGLSRGTELHLFAVKGMKAGIAAGTDAYHPEVGRILCLQGADILIHSGALEGEANCRRQAAGMWAQVQQNQCWAVEAQLYGKVCGRSYAAECCIIGPCEVTADLSGYLARLRAGFPAAVAELDEEARGRVKQAYPILSLLNPAAYG